MGGVGDGPPAAAVSRLQRPDLQAQPLLARSGGRGVLRASLHAGVDQAPSGHVMIARTALLVAVVALAVKLWWSPPVRPVYAARHRAPDRNPHRLYGTVRPSLAAVVAHCWSYD